jgi:hypothetical protein
MIHACAILTLATIDPPLFWSLTNMATIVTGAAAYGCIAAMTIASFDRAAAAIGPRAADAVRRVGLWYVWLSFLVAFGKRAGLAPGYAAATLLLLAAGGARAWSATRPRGEAGRAAKHIR